MRVYHFLNKKYGLENLQEKRLKVATIMDLNDPFELLSVELPDRFLRDAMNKTKKDISKNTGILCFSKDYHSPVQWAHYADNHQGICIGFEIKDNLLDQIKYIDKPCSLPNNIEDIDLEFMKKLLLQKYSHWSYEREWRAFVSLEEKKNNLYYKNFDGEIKVKEILVGCRSTISRQEVSEALGDLDGVVQKFKVRPAFNDFKIIKNKNSW